jgi:hypothetical protein
MSGMHPMTASGIRPNETGPTATAALPMTLASGDITIQEAS